MTEPVESAPVELLPRGVAALRPHQWPKGVSGNPKGRPPRAFTSVERFRTALAEELPGLLEVLLEKAKAGDVAAIKIIFDRVLPAYKVSEKPVAIPGLTGSLASAGAAILAAVGRGEIAAAPAAQLLLGLGAQARVEEVVELQKRIAELQKWRDEESKRPSDPIDDEEGSDGE